MAKQIAGDSPVVPFVTESANSSAWHEFLSYTYTELLHFPQRGEVKSTTPKVPFHSDLQIQLFYRLLTTTKKGASEKETYFQERKKKKKEKPFSHMHFVVKGNIYHHQTLACQNMLPPKHKKALKLREKHVQFKD